MAEATKNGTAPRIDPEEGAAQTDPVPETDPTPAADTTPGTDWKAEARKWEARAKENKGAADKLAEIEDAGKTELEKAKEEAAKAKAEAAKLKAESERRANVDKVASETGVPASVLSRMIGSTEEEIRDAADALKAGMSAYPSVAAGNPVPPKMTKEQILSIENERERKAAIAAHLDLFR